MNVVGQLAQRNPLIIDILCGSGGGVCGALLVNMMFSATGFPEILWVFVLPGIGVGGLMGGLLGRRVGRLATFVGAFMVGCFGVWMALMGLLRDG